MTDAPPRSAGRAAAPAAGSPARSPWPPGSGAAAAPAARAFPKLAKTRKTLMAELTRIAKGREARAREVLGLSPNQGGELEANRQLATAPALPAADRYTGVLYDALDLPGL